MIRTRRSAEAFPGAYPAPAKVGGGILAIVVIVAVLLGGGLGHVVGSPSEDETVGLSAAPAQSTELERFRAGLAREVDRIAAERQSGREELAATDLAPQQAANADALARVYRRAAVRLRPLIPAGNADARGIVRALNGVAARYAGLGKAAAASDDRAFARAAQAVDAAELALQDRLTAGLQA